MAELSICGAIRFAFAHHGLLHVRFHFVEALAEPTFRIVEAADHAVIQNAVEIAFLRQMIDRGRSGYPAGQGLRVGASYPPSSDESPMDL